ncbi:unnamed protein product [Caenorhabditis auriculariae]|uniref:RING-type domain-containing protein n=1 Tax=Caenorhabditis auriculariae TaxID=2777116 RepID=A0A8S1HXV1_9PELO|nr:unnamed protein product [Caenorhabditis auriculariae]
MKTYLWPPAEIRFVDNINVEWTEHDVASVMFSIMKLLDIEWQPPCNQLLERHIDDKSALNLFNHLGKNISVFCTWLNFNDIKYMALQMNTDKWSFITTSWQEIKRHQPEGCPHTWNALFENCTPILMTRKGQFLKYSKLREKVYGTVDKVDMTFKELLAKYRRPEISIEIYKKVCEWSDLKIHTMEKKYFFVEKKQFCDVLGDGVADMPDDYAKNLAEFLLNHGDKYLPLSFAGNMLFYVNNEIGRSADFDFYLKECETRESLVEKIEKSRRYCIKKPLITKLLDDFEYCRPYKYVLPRIRCDDFEDRIAEYIGGESNCLCDDKLCGCSCDEEETKKKKKKGGKKKGKKGNVYKDKLQAPIINGPSVNTQPENRGSDQLGLMKPGKPSQPTKLRKEQEEKEIIVKEEPILTKKCSLCFVVDRLDVGFEQVCCHASPPCILVVHKKCMMKAMADQGHLKKRDYKEANCPTDGCGAPLDNFFDLHSDGTEGKPLFCNLTFAKEKEARAAEAEKKRLESLAKKKPKIKKVQVHNPRENSSVSTVEVLDESLRIEEKEPAKEAPIVPPTPIKIAPENVITNPDEEGITTVRLERKVDVAVAKYDAGKNRKKFKGKRERNHEEADPELSQLLNFSTGRRERVESVSSEIFVSLMDSTPNQTTTSGNEYDLEREAIMMMDDAREEIGAVQDQQLIEMFNDENLADSLAQQLSFDEYPKMRNNGIFDGEVDKLCEIKESVDQLAEKLEPFLEEVALNSSDGIRPLEEFFEVASYFVNDLWESYADIIDMVAEGKTNKILVLTDPSDISTSSSESIESQQASVRVGVQTEESFPSDRLPIENAGFTNAHSLKNAVIANLEREQKLLEELHEKKVNEMEKQIEDLNADISKRDIEIQRLAEVCSQRKDELIKEKALMKIKEESDSEREKSLNGLIRERDSTIAQMTEKEGHLRKLAINYSDRFKKLEESTAAKDSEMETLKKRCEELEEQLNKQSRELEEKAVEVKKPAESSKDDGLRRAEEIAKIADSSLTSIFAILPMFTSANKMQEVGVKLESVLNELLQIGELAKETLCPSDVEPVEVKPKEEEWILKQPRKRNPSVSVVVEEELPKVEKAEEIPEAPVAVESNPVEEPKLSAKVSPRFKLFEASQNALNIASDAIRKLDVIIEKLESHNGSTMKDVRTRLQTFRKYIIIFGNVADDNIRAYAENRKMQPLAMFPKMGCADMTLVEFFFKHSYQNGQQMVEVAHMANLDSLERPLPNSTPPTSYIPVEDPQINQNLLSRAKITAAVASKSVQNLDLILAKLAPWNGKEIDEVKKRLERMKEEIFVVVNTAKENESLIGQGNQNLKPIPKFPTMSLFDMALIEYYIQGPKESHKESAGWKFSESRKPTEANNIGEECAICYEVLNTEDRLFQCDHCTKYTHHECLVDWFKTCQSCIYCRGHLKDPDEFPDLS